MRTIRGKRALITGAASGIGRAIAIGLAREGAQLALLDVDRDGLQRIDSEVLGSDCEPIRLPCDLRDDSQIEAAVARIVSEWGGLDILVNNAGVVYYGRTHAMSKQEWQQVLDVNLLGPAELTRLLLPHLLAQPEAHVVNVSSMYGYVATNRCTAYHLTKSALIGFSEALRAECARSGLGVSVICPAFVRTGLFASMARGTGRVTAPPAWMCTTPENVARKAIRAIYRNRRMVLAGWLAHCVHLIRRVAPGLFDRMYHVRRPNWLKSRKRDPARLRQSAALLTPLGK